MRIDYLSPTLYLTDVLIIGLTFFWVIENIFSAKGFSKVISIVRDNVSKLLIIFFFVLFLLVGISQSKNPAAGIYGIIKFLEYLILFSYTVKNFRILNKSVLFSIFICGVLFESFLTIAQYFNQGSIGGIFYFLGERSFNSQTPGIANSSINGQLFLRPYATFSHPNVLAAYLCVFMVLIIYYSKRKFFKHQNIVLLLIYICGSISLFLTLSRVSLFAWSAIVIFFITYDFWKKTRMVSTKKVYLQKIKNKVLPLIFLIAVLFVFTFPIGLRFFQFSLSDQTVVQREVLIRNSVTMFLQQPIFGIGLNNFLVNLPFVQKQYQEALYIQPVHNIYFLVLSETGSVGLVVLLYCLWITYRRLKKNTNFELLALFILILFLGFFDHYFFTLQQGQLLIVIIFGLFWSDPKKTTMEKNANIKT